MQGIPEVAKMNIGGFIKRALPFVAAFSLGVLIASFFVDLRRPRIGPDFKKGRCSEVRRLRAELEAARNENLRLRNEFESLQMRMGPLRHPEMGEWPGTALDGLPPAPPVAKRAQ